MMDTGEDREIRARVEAREAEVVRESKTLLARFKEKLPRKPSPGKKRKPHRTDAEIAKSDLG